jgi:DNA-binding winged helix-turn-helix (wHTH) protein
MSHAGRVVSREMIIRHVWDKSFEGVADIVDVYISQLRKKVDTGYEAKLVHDVRGLGYMICGANPHKVWQASAEAGDMSSPVLKLAFRLQRS